MWFFNGDNYACVKNSKKNDWGTDNKNTVTRIVIEKWYNELWANSDESIDISCL